MTTPSEPGSAGGVVTVVANRAKFHAWLDFHERQLRPHYPVTGRGGSSPRLCMRSARAAILASPNGEHAVLNCVYLVIHAYRLAGLIDRIAEAEHWHTALLEVAACHEQAGDHARGARLRAQAEADSAEAHGLESVEHGAKSTY